MRRDFFVRWGYTGKHTEEMYSVEFIELKTKYREPIMAIAKKRNIGNVRVFGSVAKGTTHAGSDLDLLVHLQSGADLVDLSGFCLDLEDLLKQKIDVIPDNSIHWSIKEQVLKEATPL